MLIKRVKKLKVENKIDQNPKIILHTEPVQLLLWRIYVHMEAKFSITRCINQLRKAEAWVRRWNRENKIENRQLYLILYF